MAEVNKRINGHSSDLEHSHGTSSALYPLWSFRIEFSQCDQIVLLAISYLNHSQTFIFGHGELHSLLIRPNQVGTLVHIHRPLIHKCHSRWRGVNIDPARFVIEASIIDF